MGQLEILQWRHMSVAVSHITSNVTVKQCFRLTSKKTSCRRHWLFVRSPVDSPHKGPVRREKFLCHNAIRNFYPHSSLPALPRHTWWRHQMALMFSLICAWTHGWVNTREAGDLRHHRAHYDVTVMSRSRNQTMSAGVSYMMSSISPSFHVVIVFFFNKVP